MSDEPQKSHFWMFAFLRSVTRHLKSPFTRFLRTKRMILRYCEKDSFNNSCPIHPHHNIIDVIFLHLKISPNFLADIPVPVTVEALYLPGAQAGTQEKAPVLPPNHAYKGRQHFVPSHDPSQHLNHFSICLPGGAGPIPSI